ncbi:MAG: hypothetical protein COA67_06505 [Lutibacter sp.]|nr:MAG: hypothetical protein COA67_06505 [Lutibacter sp.]
MKAIYSKSNNLVFIFLLLPMIIFSQKTESMWKKTSKIDFPSSEKILRKTEPNVASYYQLDIESLKKSLKDTPKRGTSSKSNVIVDFPHADGKLYSYSVMEASVFHPDLQAKYPNIRSYVGQGIENPSTIIRFSVTPQGLHAMLLSTDQGTQYIDPYSKNGNDYITYARKNLPVLDEKFICEFIDDEVLVDSGKEVNSFKNADDGQLRKFRLAVAGTNEYSSFHWMAAGVAAGDSDAAKKAAVLTAMGVTMTRVNGIYERDLAITMEIIPTNENVIFVDVSVDDGLTDDNASAMLNEITGVLNSGSGVGSASYDIGHVFSTSGGGVAILNSPCTGNKARGVTGLGSPVGDPYDIDYVAHEMGHQFGAPHTFNSSVASCLAQRTASNAYEVGSGSTIMAYAGICTPQNVQSNSDAYFHQKSIEMIWDNITPGGAVSNSICAAQSALTSNPNAPTSIAGGDYTIPISTPYVLTGSSTDNDGTASHTFTWEQFDLGPAGVPTETTATGPLVRSFEGTSNPIRFIPRMQDLLLAPGSTDWEKLVSISRDIDFLLTVRDNGIGGGQTAMDGMTVTTSDTSGPFVVTSQSALSSWIQNTTETITWDIAGTNTGAVNTPNVDILLSIDGGMTYPTVLASTVPNDGTHDITVPNISEENCRIMVKGANNIFFNINAAQIGIGYSLVAGEVCETYDFTVNQTLTPNAGVFETVDTGNVSDFGAITDINFKFDITSPELGQLHLRLIGPTGAVSYPINGGCSGNADMEVLWDDEAGSAVVCASPTTGSATPRTGQELSVFDGTSMNGNWSFSCANTGSTNMVLNTVSLEICKDGVIATVLSVEENIFDVFNIYPNPSNGTVNISLSSIDDVQVSLYDIRGRLISSEVHANNSGTFKKELNFGTVSSGVYLLNVKSGNKTATKKLIIQ